MTGLTDMTYDNRPRHWRGGHFFFVLEDPMKSPSPMIDPKVLQADVLKLMTNDTVRGLTVNEVSSVLVNRDEYVQYQADYVLEWTQSMLDKLCGQGLVVLKGNRYFPAEPAATP